MISVRLLRAAAAFSPVSATASQRLDRALTQLSVPVGSAIVVEAAVGTLLVGAALAGVATVAGLRFVAIGMIGLAAVVAAALVVLPEWLATAHQTKALGELPDLVAFAVLRLHVDPTPERAAEFAAEHAAGPLAASLREQVRRSRGRATTGWTGFARMWAADVPTLPRATALLQAAAAAEPPDRPTLLEDALTVVLDGTRERMAAFAAALRGPTTALYAFGVVLPLATIGALPTLRAAGIPISIPALAVVYDGLLPAAVLCAGAWLVSQRPAAFPPASVRADHPALPDRRRHLLIVVPLTALGTAVLSTILYPPWSRFLVVPTVTLGGALVAWYRPIRSLRDRTRTIEAGLPAALTIVGQRLQHGTPPEVAIADAAEIIDGPTGEVFAVATRVHRRLGVDLTAAFHGPQGALAHVSSPRLAACVTLLAVAGREGHHGGDVVIAVADHLDALATVQTDARRELGAIVGTLRSTACCFAPLIGGVTVALAARIGATGLSRSVTSVDTTGLGLVVGAYVTLLAVLLAGLSATLERGLDRAVLGEQVGYALLSAGFVYPTTVLAAGWLV